jgi:phenylpropionate dioxygenase-like ring-hydroxylating dioxygenase large terminal subunit
MPTVQEILSADPGPPAPEPYREVSTRSFGIRDVPLDRFISADYQRREYDRLWSRVWQWACNIEDIPELGDHIVYDIGDRSVLLVRVTPDRIKAYHNACLHRGRQLKDGPGSSQKLMCGFHGWTWKLDGSLDRIPCRWDFPQVCDAEFALPEVRCETWSRFVFVNFDDDAPPLAEALDVLPGHYEHFPLDDKVTVAWVQKVIPANWKVTMEAFMESYHEIATHPQLLEWSGDANSQYDVWERVNRSNTLLAVPSPHLPETTDEEVYAAALQFMAAGSPEPVSTELPEGESPRAAIADLTRQMMGQMLGRDLSDRSISEMIDGVDYWVFPNWMPWPGMANALQYRFRPNGEDPHSCVFDIRMMMPTPQGAPPLKVTLHELAPDEPWSNAPELGAFGPIMEQDESNLRAIQKGLRATKRTGIPYSAYQESRIRHFHQLLDDYLAD